MKRLAARALTAIALLAIVLQSFVPYITYFPKAYAQEDTPPTVTETVTPTSDQTPTPTDTVTPTPTETPAPETTTEPTPTPTVDNTVIATPTPTDDLSPPTDNSNNQSSDNNSSANSGQAQGTSTSVTPTETVSPTPTPEATTGDEQLSMTILKNVSAPTIDLPTVISEGSASLTTDKLDYAPTDTALITGTNLNPNTTYSLTISSSDNPATSTTINVTSDDKGVFAYAYQLDGHYRPNYKAELKDGTDTIVATTTFTDSLTTVSATLNGTSNVTVYPGTPITIAVTATLTSTNVWHRTVGKINTVGVFNFDTGTNKDICEDTPDHNTPGTYTESVTVNAPSSVGTYNVYVRTAGGENCNSATNDADLVLTGAVVVVADTTPPACPVPVLTSISGSHYINGNTIYYSPVTSTTGSFKLTESPSDDSGLISKVNFPTIATFTGGGE